MVLIWVRKRLNQVSDFHCQCHNAHVILETFICRSFSTSLKRFNDFGCPEFQRIPCIILTVKGEPDVATRQLFLSKVKLELKLPVLALVDSDPYGLKWSKNLSYDSANLTTPDIKRLGIRPSDLDKYKIPEQCRLTMTDQDIKTGKEMLEEDFVKKNPKWVEESSHGENRAKGRNSGSERVQLSVSDSCSFSTKTAEAGLDMSPRSCLFYSKS